MSIKETLSSLVRRPALVGVVAGVIVGGIITLVAIDYLAVRRQVIANQQNIATIVSFLNQATAPRPAVTSTSTTSTAE